MNSLEEIKSLLSNKNMSIEELTKNLSILQSKVDESTKNIIEHSKLIADLQNRPICECGISTAETTNGDLEFADQNGNVIMRLASGHIKTKNFDSKTVQSNANEDIIIIY